MKKSTVKKEEKIITQIIERYGDLIDLKKMPYAIIEILRKFGKDISEDNGNPCGGTPPVPGPSGIPIIMGDDLMKEILKLSRAVKILDQKFEKISSSTK